ncbi:hypothetical protein BX661DRAFT_65056 [Kickxella alabastrina]|uniref:uncharacterized protein n=1 Tax=Kickxella alabastrina TaxID=61397 RepID=UPI00221EE438|nr:uncharacterized protein BX661DRAFT_65056 [Kickxella alabastrina]KAI7833763.1 hypothetical protein BX661DRAFT_65056 [Kickxella alabastrina]
MPPHNVYTGRANKGTLTTVESAGKLYIVYASGQEVVIHSNSRRYVQSVSHISVSETIKRLAASPSGQLATVSGHIITVFEDTHLDGGEWKYASHFALERTNSGDLINCCEWMDDQRLLLAIDDILSLWAVSEGVWTKQWERSVGCHIDKISAAAGQAVFATVSFDSRMVKVWQIPEIGGYLRFHSDLRFVLAATIDAAMDYAESRLGSNKRRKLVSVNAQCRQRTRTIIQDSDALNISKCSAGDNSKSAAFLAMTKAAVPKRMVPARMRSRVTLQLQIPLLAATTAPLPITYMVCTAMDRWRFGSCLRIHIYVLWSK